MDPITTLYYAVICAVLAHVSGGMRIGAVRIVTGAAVGVLAAAALPMLRGAFGL